MYANIKASNIRRDLEDKMTVVGYCRLSRDEDKENFISIEEQKRIISDGYRTGEGNGYRAIPGNL